MNAFYPSHATRRRKARAAGNYHFASWHRFASLFVFLILTIALPAESNAKVQRMRVSAGRHTFGGGGGGGSAGSTPSNDIFQELRAGRFGRLDASRQIPAACIDLGDPPPKNGNTMVLAESSAVTVTRQKGTDGPIEGPFPISEVTQENGGRYWFKLKGNATAGSLDVEYATRGDAEYTYTLDVAATKPAVFGDSEAEKKFAGKAGDTESAEAAVVRLVADPKHRILQALDEVDATIRDTFRGTPDQDRIAEFHLAKGEDISDASLDSGSADHLWFAKLSDPQPPLRDFLRGWLFDLALRHPSAIQLVGPRLQALAPANVLAASAFPSGKDWPRFLSQMEAARAVMEKLEVSEVAFWKMRPEFVSMGQIEFSEEARGTLKRPFRTAFFRDEQIADKLASHFQTLGLDFDRISGLPAGGAELATLRTEVAKLRAKVSEFQSKAPKVGQILANDIANHFAETGRAELPTRASNAFQSALRRQFLSQAETVTELDALLRPVGLDFEKASGLPIAGEAADKMRGEIASVRQRFAALRDAFPPTTGDKSKTPPSLLEKPAEHAEKMWELAFVATGSLEKARLASGNIWVPAKCSTMPDPIEAARLLPGDWHSRLFSERPLTDRQRRVLADLYDWPAEPSKSPLLDQFAFIDYNSFEGLVVRTTDGEKAFARSKPEPAQLLAAIGKRRLCGRAGLLADLPKAFTDASLKKVFEDAIPVERVTSILRRSAFEPLAPAQRRLQGIERLTEQRYMRARKDSEFASWVIRLPGKDGEPGKGDAILFEYPDGRLMLIDAGNDRAAFETILGHIRALRPEAKHLDVLITHEHQDHIGGLSSMIEVATKPDGLTIGQIFIGTSEPDAPKVTEVIASLKASGGYSEVKGWSERKFLVLENAKAQAAAGRPPLTLRRGFRLSGKVDVLKLEGIPGVEMELIRLKEPASANDSSILVRVTHNGILRLYTGDLDVRGIRTLLDARVDLRADILKHPHHVSFRKKLSVEDLATMEEFIREVNPHTVLLSNRGSGQTDAMEAELRAFYHSTLDRQGLPPVRIEGTNDINEEGVDLPGATRGFITDKGQPSSQEACILRVFRLL